VATPHNAMIMSHACSSRFRWVPLTVLITFNRLKQLTTDVAAIAEVIKASNSELVEISEDSTKVSIALALQRDRFRATFCRFETHSPQIRRVPNKPLPSQAVINQRSIYAKGFPLEGTTIDSARQYFSDKGVKVLSVILRRNLGKGGTFIHQ
jgi:hypothetical protein